MGGTRLEVVATLYDIVSAEAFAQRLRAEGVPAELRCDTALLGAARLCEVLVPSELLHRTRWLLAQAELSDTELTEYACAALPEGPASESR